MATFGKTTFNTARYAAARPTYPRQLYDFIFKYHESKLGAKWERAVDLGCGTGAFCLSLALSFASIQHHPLSNVLPRSPLSCCN